MFISKFNYFKRDALFRASLLITSQPPSLNVSRHLSNASNVPFEKELHKHNMFSSTRPDDEHSNTVFMELGNENLLYSRQAVDFGFQSVITSNSTCHERLVSLGGRCQSSWSNIPKTLIEREIVPLKSLDRLIVDLNFYNFQMDHATSLTSKRSGTGSFSISDILRTVSETVLIKIFKQYGVMTASEVRHVMNGVIEGRYMFHKFENVSELKELVSGAAKLLYERKAFSGQDDYAYTFQSERDSLGTLINPNSSASKTRRHINSLDDLSEDLLLRVLTSLRIFVHDHANELSHLISVLGGEFLRPGSGRLAIVTDSPALTQILVNHFNRSYVYKSDRVENTFGFAPNEKEASDTLIGYKYGFVQASDAQISKMSENVGRKMWNLLVNGAPTDGVKMFPSYKHSRLFLVEKDDLTTANHEMMAEI